MIYSMSKDIVDNRKSDFVYVVYRSERYHSSWVGQGGCYPKVYICIYTRKKDRIIVRVERSVGIMPTYAEVPGVAGIRLAVCRIHTTIS